ncbi:exodeoxyribonuclease V subunit gamma [Thiocystis violacea]|uniref:exodeoxyribonuclease V subunit gamma n=1 Tax=Thiocystis violacea TaxID=13725 RepID=UPI0019037DB6|nr:exodeoxyribonuclease V subunit gamma [Thiocystis violacea]MBK1725298.1 hypothetical protein [Thiocystis violacea]
MLYIIASNAVESLLASLGDHIITKRSASPLVPELVVVPSPAMGRWVNVRLAERHGVATNLVYPLPATFIWQLARDLLPDIPEQDPLAIDRMAWRLFACLPDVLAEPGFETLRHYLSGDSLGLKRWQLASRIADAFDRYQLYRPGLIRCWIDDTGTVTQSGRQNRAESAKKRHSAIRLKRMTANFVATFSCSGSVQFPRWGFVPEELLV